MPPRLGGLLKAFEAQQLEGGRILWKITFKIFKMDDSGVALFQETFKLI